MVVFNAIHLSHNCVAGS